MTHLPRKAQIGLLTLRSLDVIARSALVFRDEAIPGHEEILRAVALAMTCVTSANKYFRFMIGGTNVVFRQKEEQQKDDPPVLCH